MLSARSHPSSNKICPSTLFAFLDVQNLFISIFTRQYFAHLMFHVSLFVYSFSFLPCLSLLQNHTIHPIITTNTNHRQIPSSNHNLRPTSTNNPPNPRCVTCYTYCVDDSMDDRMSSFNARVPPTQYCEFLFVIYIFSCSISVYVCRCVLSLDVLFFILKYTYIYVLIYNECANECICVVCRLESSAQLGQGIRMGGGSVMPITGPGGLQQHPHHSTLDRRSSGSLRVSHCKQHL